MECTRKCKDSTSKKFYYYNTELGVPLDETKMPWIGRLDLTPEQPWPRGRAAPPNATIQGKGFDRR